MKKCINCGREIPDEAVFCGFCGTRQPETGNNDETEKQNIPPVTEDVKEEQVTSDSVIPETSDPKEVKEDTESEIQKPEEASDSESTSEQNVTEDAEGSDQEEYQSEDDSKIRDAGIIEPSETKEEKKPDGTAVSADQTESDHKATEDDKEKRSESVTEETVMSAGENDTEISDAEIAEPSETDRKSAEKESEDDSGIRDAEIKESSEPEKRTAEETAHDEKKEESSSEKRKKKPHAQIKKTDLPEIHISKEDFRVLLDLIRNPVERRGINNTTTWIILIFAWIADWVAFRSFTAGFFSLLIVLIGMIVLNWLTLKDHATFGETVRNSAEVIFTPSLLVFAGGLFIRNVTAGAEVFAFHSIFTTAFIGLFFLTAALILFLLIVMKRYEMKIWQMLLILTIFTSLLIWYLMTSGAIALFS